MNAFSFCLMSQERERIETNNVDHNFVMMTANQLSSFKIDVARSGAKKSKKILLIKFATI